MARARGVVTPSVTVAVSARGLAAPGTVEAGGLWLPQEDAGALHLRPGPSHLGACVPPEPRSWPGGRSRANVRATTG